jgi:hypothetical protein
VTEYGIVVEQGRDFGIVNEQFQCYPLQFFISGPSSPSGIKRFGRQVFIDTDCWGIMKQPAVPGQRYQGAQVSCSSHQMKRVTRKERKGLSDHRGFDHVPDLFRPV